MSDELRTSARLVGDDAERFRALCALRGMRPHQLAAEAVRQLLITDLRDPVVGEAVEKLVANARAYRAEQPPAHVAERGGFRLFRGGVS